MSDKQENGLEEAIAWHLKVPTMRDEDWPEFIGWLESSAANRADYDRVAASDLALGQIDIEALPEPAAEPTARGQFRSQTFRRGVYATAASLALALGIWSWLPTGSALRTEQTLPGDIRQLSRGEGTIIALNGDSRIILDDKNPRSALLEQGEALFTVKHSAKPFEVMAGGIQIRDLGTIFNVRLEPNSLHVAVKEGAVLVDPAGIALRVNAGEKVDLDLAKAIAVKGRDAQAADWVKGEFSFENSSVKEVVSAVRRRSGIELSVSTNLSQQPFTGNIKLSGDEAADVARLAKLLGADYRRAGKVWHLSASSERN